jgi:paraquat-inducible protein A
MERVACPHCDLLHAAVELADGEEARCIRCGAALPLPHPPDGSHAQVAILATAMVAFAIAVSTPLMRMSIMGRAADATLPGSALYMWFTGSPVAAVLVALFTLVLPATYLGLAFAASAGALRSPVPRWAGHAARWARRVTPWAMPEIMLLATLVAYVKISELADAAPGLGMYATAGLAVMLALGRNAAHVPTVWARIPWSGAAT